jgi:hypothetical protein
MFVINAQAQRIVTVVNAVPRNLAVVIKQIGEGKTDAPAEQKAEAKVEQVEAAPQETAPAAETEAAPSAEQETATEA